MTDRYEFSPKWKELLVCKGPTGEFELDFVMGVPTVYAPTETQWRGRYPNLAYQDFADELSKWCEGRNANITFCDDAFLKPIG